MRIDADGMSPLRRGRTALAGLITGAVVWGLIWYPYRVLGHAGLGGVESSTLTYLVALMLGLGLLRGDAMPHGARWPLAVIGLAGGACNVAYVHATLHGEIFRVLLLFYLAPLWTVLLAHVLLGERAGRAGIGVVMMSLAGAAVMLWRPGQGTPLPGSVAEWEGLGAGMLFALSNVLIRRTGELPIPAKTVAVFLGAVVVGITYMLVSPVVQMPLAQLDIDHWTLVVVLGAVLVAVNLIVQFGLMHVAANRAIVIMLFELVVAAAAAWLLAGEATGLQDWIGGAMIVTASLVSGHLEANHEHRDGAAA